MATQGIRGSWAALALLVAALSACGGGSGEPPPAVRAPTLQVDAYIQPAGTPDVAGIRSRTLAKSEALQAERLDLGPLDQTKAGEALPEGGARLIGVARAVPGTDTPEGFASRLRWQGTPDGGHIAALSIAAQGAHGLRLGLRVAALPGSARVRVYTPSDPGTVYEVSGQQILQTLERNAAAGETGADAQTWWTPELGAGEQTVEIELPRGQDPALLRVSLPGVSHIFEDLSLPPPEAMASKINESVACNLDATCHDELAAQRNAVARMLFTQGGKTYVCTGTLLNDAASSGTPYFLSANHCISTQAGASTLQTDWFYRSPSCNSRTLSATSARRIGGATLLWASAGTDMALLRLNDAPPSGAVFAGWDVSGVAPGSAVAGLHHPRGDLLKASFGSLAGQTACTPTSGTEFNCSGSSGNFYRVGWSRGTTEGGSSGSALFRANRVVGTLYGGNASCGVAQSMDVYGRLDVAYAAGLNQWLGAAMGPGHVPVYRFYNHKTGAHFYTSSEGERDYVIATNPNFLYEHVAFYVNENTGAQQSPVFRFYNRRNGAHFYTISVAERDYVNVTQPDFLYEGNRWFAQTAEGVGTVPIFRFYNPRTGAHFYTVNRAERDFVIAYNPDFLYEGIAYHAWSAP